MSSRVCVTGHIKDPLSLVSRALFSSGRFSADLISS